MSTMERQFSMKYQWKLLLCTAAALVSTACTGSPEGLPGSTALPTNISNISDVNMLVNIGVAQGEAGNVDAAKAAFQKAVSLDATNKYAWYNLGYLAQRQNHSSDALASYNRAIAADPKYTPAMFNKAIVLEATDTTAAMDLYQQIVQINPKASTAYLRLGLLQLKVNDKDGAAASFASALKADPTLASQVPPQYRTPRTPTTPVSPTEPS